VENSSKLAGMDAPGSTEPASLIYELVEQAYAFTLAISRWTAALLADLQLTAALADVLWHLEPTDEAVSMRHLAGRLQCDPSNVTFLADRLEQRGLIERRTDPSDRRVKLVALTPAGLRMRHQILQAAAARSPLARLSPTDQGRLLDLLAKTRTAGPTPPL
jgi:MarR family transcriptional regulator, organic hydroperoxide resistance regulator